LYKWRFIVLDKDPWRDNTDATAYKWGIEMVILGNI
jgi:hypothetical protein